MVPPQSFKYVILFVLRHVVIVFISSGMHDRQNIELYNLLSLSIIGGEEEGSSEWRRDLDEIIQEERFNIRTPVMKNTVSYSRHCVENERTQSN